jgi:hypothetical protein
LLCDERPIPDPPYVTRIPLRYNPSTPPTFTKEDIILHEGDIVIIRSRDDRNFCHCRVLGGGEHPLPRDKDLDIIGAIAIAGGSLGSTGTGVGSIGGTGMEAAVVVAGRQSSGLSAIGSNRCPGVTMWKFNLNAN